MKVLVTGNLGYIGSVLTNKLQQQGYSVVGYDIGYYSDCITSECKPPNVQIKKDLRKIDENEVEGVDYIIHLASLSNDPLGAFMPNLTEEINYESTIKLAEYAKKLLCRHTHKKQKMVHMSYRTNKLPVTYFQK